MKLYSFLLMLLVYGASGQTLPETNNKAHYSDLLARQEIDLLYGKLKAGNDFDKLARAYSQDYGTYTVGGKLGWQKTDLFVPEFSKAVSQLTKAQLSKPFKSEFGYHIVQLLDRKEGEVLTRHILLRVEK